MPALKPEAVESVRSRHVLTPSSGFLHAFTHTLNPYMGCAFGEGGCGVYCYVAESPIGLHAGKPWGQWLRAKENAAEALLRDLDALPDPREARIFMSSATDPYQPAESRLRITRSVLDVFRERPVGLLVVQTRSPLVERDFDLMAEMPFAWLSMTVETDDDAVRRALTPTCPAIHRRFEAMRRARQYGIRVQAAVSPLLPHEPERFAALLEGVADRVIVDTFFGDGSDGARTRRRPLPRRYEELGWGDWRDTTAAEHLHGLLGARFGERAGWSRDGFNALAMAEVAGRDRGCAPLVAPAREEAIS
ncbi:MAG: radical SAM protein [Dehalococcoidia bacterium]